MVTINKNHDGEITLKYKYATQSLKIGTIYKIKIVDTTFKVNSKGLLSYKKI